MAGVGGWGVNGKVGAQTGGVGELGYRVPFAGEGKQEEGSRGRRVGKRDICSQTGCKGNVYASVFL